MLTREEKTVKEIARVKKKQQRNEKHAPHESFLPDKSRQIKVNQ